MNNVSSLLTSLYGNSVSTGNASAIGTPSSTVAARVEQTLAAQRGTVVRLNASLSSSQTRLSGLGQLQSALGAFQDIADSLAGAGLSTSATVSTKGVLSISTGATAAAGSHDIDITQLAQSQVLQSAATDSADTAIGTGAPATIQVTVGGKTKSITIDQRNNTLAGIASAFKEAGIDAQVVKSGTGSALQLRSTSGAGQALEIKTTGDAAIKNLFNGLQQTQAAQDARLTVDGKQVSSADNSVENAIAGATLELGGKGKATVTISRDSSQISKNVSAFVAGFNALSERLATLDKGALKGDNALKQVSGQLEQLVKLAGADKLADAGLTLEGGKLKLDSKKLQAAITADPDAVGKLFTNEGRGIADQLGARIESLTGSSGIIRRETAQVGKEISTLNGKRSELAQALTAQAKVLAQFYSQQEQAGANPALPGLPGSGSSLFDFFA